MVTILIILFVNLLAIYVCIYCFFNKNDFFNPTKKESIQEKVN